MATSNTIDILVAESLFHQSCIRGIGLIHLMRETIRYNLPHRIFSENLSSKTTDSVDFQYSSAILMFSRIICFASAASWIQVAASCLSNMARQRSASVERSEVKFFLIRRRRVFSLLKAKVAKIITLLPSRPESLMPYGAYQDRHSSVRASMSRTRKSSKQPTHRLL